MTTLERMLAQRERPGGRPAMYHSWRQLTFLHWEVPVDAVQRSLPPGLTVDTFEGRAYVGLVPFTMSGIRLRGLPALPGLSASHETNVRTYVVDENGVPGVWFFSLDAANLAFVATARAWYSLPYFHSSMQVDVDGVRVDYECRRRSPHIVRSRVTTRTSDGPFVAEPGTLEFFLVERYVLFAHSRGRLFSGRVWHQPYPVCAATCERVDDELVRAAGFALPDVEPHVLFSPGVDVDVYGLRRV